VRHTARSALTILIGARPPSKSAAQQLLRQHGFCDTTSVYAGIVRLADDELQRTSLRRIFPHLVRACIASADPDRALLNFERLTAALPNPSMFYHYLQTAPDRLDLLVKVFAHSQALSDTLARNAAYFHFLIAPTTLRAPRPKVWLTAELDRLLMPVRQTRGKYDVIRHFRRREMLRIGVRDLNCSAPVEETTLELSNLADVCLQAVYSVAFEKMCREFKTTGVQFAVIGMGKLGGQELNYSSDVDVIFVYDEEGQLTPALSRHDFCRKLGEEIVREVGSKSNEGTIFRIDLRLRPEGSSGPLVRSLEGCESYYAEWGETWERMALIKARCVAGNAQLGDEFVQMVQPFVYARHAGVQVVQQMAAIKQRIETEIVRDDRLTRHVKLGIGGIREIEFIVQSFQVLHGGRQPHLRDRSTLRTLQLLTKARLLEGPAATTLAVAYRFLRNVEHRLQMEMELQTHTIPDEANAQYRLARSLGFATVAEFHTAQNAQTGAVRKIYEAILTSAAASPSLTNASMTDVTTLTRAGFVDAGAASQTMGILLNGSGVAHVSPRTKELFSRLYPVICATAGKLAEPDAALARFEKFVSAYGSRGLLYELLTRNPKLVEMLLRLGDASKYFADTLVQQPDLFDEVCRGIGFGEARHMADMEAGLQTARQVELPAAEVARIWKRAEMLRIGIGDVMEMLNVERVQAEMTGLAEVSLRFALAEECRALKLKKLPFAIIGLGKFGGQELGYGADLDVLFVGADTDAIKLATRVIDFMARPTAAGKLFEVDARLRPDGKDGVLASPVAAHRDYYRQRAQLWERQALIKTRVVAGDAALGADFIRMIHEYVYATPLTVEQVTEICQMRHRIETERGNQQHVELEFKTGPGGIIDVEFLVQTLQLRHGATHPQLHTAHTLAALNRLAALGLVEENDSVQLRRHYLFLRRIEAALRRVENSNVSHIPAHEHEQTILAKRLGFQDAGAFLTDYRHATGRLRTLYKRLMPTSDR
jgi:[glutamine synthetase] adenylyltransferase / [glutamine synthetase]-adenylyl-L-tyrosine phosphorylase